MASLLEEQYSYLISENSDVTDDALLDDELYVVDAYDRDGVDWYQVRRINLTTDRGWDGLVEASIDGKAHDGERGYLSVQDGVVLIQGVAGLVLDAKTLETRFDEESVKTDVWERGGYAFIYNDLYYRRRAVLQPVGGMDVVNMETSEVVDFLDCDIEDRTIPYEGVLYGERANGNFALYSVIEKKYTLEIECEKYGEEQERGLRFSMSDGFLYLICGGYLLVIEIDKALLVKEIKYVDDLRLQALVKENGCEPIASVISACGSIVGLSRGWLQGWFGVIDMSTGGTFDWVNCSDESYIQNAFGDLLYGTLGGFPMAVDKYNGEIVWQAKQSAIVNDIHVGKSWVIYSSLAGKIQCYRMLDEEYRSPAQSVA